MRANEDIGRPEKNDRGSAQLTKSTKNHQQKNRTGQALSEKSYYFCSVGCRAEFQRHPEDYIKRGPKESGIQHV